MVSHYVRLVLGFAVISASTSADCYSALVRASFAATTYETNEVVTGELVYRTDVPQRTSGQSAYPYYAEFFDAVLYFGISSQFGDQLVTIAAYEPKMLDVPLGSIIEVGDYDDANYYWTPYIGFSAFRDGKYLSLGLIDRGYQQEVIPPSLESGNLDYATVFWLQGESSNAAIITSLTSEVLTNTYWIGATVGEFDDAKYWAQSSPESDDVVVFGAPYFTAAPSTSVSFAVNPSMKALEIQGGNVRWNLDGHGATVTERLSIGGHKDATFQLNGGSFSASSIQIGNQSQREAAMLLSAGASVATNSLTISGAAESPSRLEIDNSSLWVNGNAEFGSAGRNTLELRNGAQSTITDDATFDRNSIANITGAGTELVVEGTTSLGVEGEAEFTAMNQASLRGKDLVIGKAAASAGSLTVDSRALGDFAGAATIGVRGSGNLTLLDGGHFRAKSVIAAQEQTSTAKIEVRGPVTQLTTIEDFSLEGAAEVGVKDGATVDIRRDLRSHSGSVVVEGDSSSFIVGRDLEINSNNSANLEVKSGGRVEVDRHLLVGLNRTGISRLAVSGQDSVVEVDESVSIGNSQSSGEIVVDNDARFKSLGDAVTVGKNGRLVGSGIELGNWLNKTNLVNAGRIELKGQRIESNGRNANATMTGNYSQTADATLMMTLSPTDKLNLGSVSVGMVVEGTAALAGTFEVELANGYVPAVGDRFAAIIADDLTGRFARFDAPEIGTREFLALNYREVTKGNAAQAKLKVSSDDSDKVVEVVTLETPRGLRNASSDLVLIIHGTNSNAENFYEVSGAIRNRIARDSEQGNVRSVDVALFDWRDYAGGDDDPFYNQHWPIIGADPVQSANNGVNIGEGLAKWMAKNGKLTYERIHVLGHSSGSWLADSMVDELKRIGQSSVQLTLWDSFVPPDLVFRQGDDGPLDESALGDSADFAEQYYDQAGILGKAVLFTQEVLPNAVNIDLSGVSGRTIVGSHSWPYQWYGKTASGDKLGVGGFGFDRSMVNGPFPTYTEHQRKGANILVADAGGQTSAGFERVTEAMNFAQAQQIVSGTVSYDHNGALLTTNSPSMLTSIFDITSPASYISFDLDFYTAAEGLLSLYIGDQLVWELNSETLTGIEGIINSGWIDIPDLDAGRHSMIFRVDNLTSEQVQVRVEDINFSTLVLAGDFTGDEIVDGADFLAWQRGSASATELGKWKSNFGASFSSGSPSAAVPEPSSLPLLLISLLCLGLRHAAKG